MKFLLIVISLVAAVSSRATPITSHTLEVGSNGLVGTSILSPLVSIIININKGLENLISVEGLPSEAVVTPVTPALPSPALPENPQPQPIIVIDNAPEAVIVVDQAPVQPQPVVIVDQVPETVIIVDQTPVPSQPIVVDEVPESVIIVDQVEVQPVVIVDQTPELVTVVESAPETVVVVDQAPIQEPVIVGPAIIDNLVPLPVPETESSSSVTNNFLINVLLNVVLGSDGPSSSGPVTVASSPSMSDVIQQIFGSFLPSATAPRD